MDCTIKTDYRDLNNDSECDKSYYNSAERIKEYGVDCCIREAKYNMRNFSLISRNIRLDNAIVSNIAEKLLM